MNYKSCFSTSFVLECFIVKTRNSIPYFSHTIPSMTDFPPPFPHPLLPCRLCSIRFMLRPLQTLVREVKDSISLFKNQPAHFCTCILTVHFWKVMQDRFKTLLSSCCDEHLSSHISSSGAPIIVVYLYCFPLTCVVKHESPEMLALFTISATFEMHQMCIKQIKLLRVLSLVML